MQARYMSARQAVATAVASLCPLVASLFSSECWLHACMVVCELEPVTGRVCLMPQGATLHSAIYAPFCEVMLASSCLVFWCRYSRTRRTLIVSATPSTCVRGGTQCYHLYTVTNPVGCSQRTGMFKADARVMQERAAMGGAVFQRSMCRFLLQPCKHSWGGRAPQDKP